MSMSTDIAAMNATLFSYADHSLGNPKKTPTNQQTWWTEERIETTVTVEYILSRLRLDDRGRIRQPLAFGDGLTDDTYLDFILERGRKLFLILCEVGQSSQIFRTIDHAFDDDDLPLAPEAILDLGLAPKVGDKANRRFHSIQYRYLLRNLEECGHTDFAAEDVVPLELVNGAAPAKSLENWVRVRTPTRPGELLARRHLVTIPPDAPDDFLGAFHEDLDAARLIEHDHVAPVWGSYSSKGAGYVLTPFVAQHTLQSYLENKSIPQFAKLTKPSRHQLLLGWMHCLSHGLAHLHSNGFQHTAIRPSNIVIDSANTVSFSDIGSLRVFQNDKRADPNEVYDYGAPEAHLGERYLYVNSSFAGSVRAGLSSSVFYRKRSREDKSDDSPVEGSYNVVHIDGLGQGRDATPTVHSPTSDSNKSFSSGDRFGFSTPVQSPVVADSRSFTSSKASYTPTEKADIFSLGCIFIDILSFMHKFKRSEITKHIKSTRKPTKGQKGSGSRVDSSFHANLPRVNSWLDILEDKAFENDDHCFRAVPHLVRMVRAMLCAEAEARPSAAAVRDHIKAILTQFAKIRETTLHCCEASRGWGSYTPEPIKLSSSLRDSTSASEGRHSGYTTSSRYASSYSGTSTSATSTSMSDRFRVYQDLAKRG